MQGPAFKPGKTRDRKCGLKKEDDFFLYSCQMQHDVTLNQDTIQKLSIKKISTLIYMNVKIESIEITSNSSLVNCQYIAA